MLALDDKLLEGTVSTGERDSGKVGLSQATERGRQEQRVSWPSEGEEGVRRPCWGEGS